MSEIEPEVQRTRVILIDDGGWVAKTFIHEVKENRKDVDIAEIIKVPPLCPLKEILDKIPVPSELVVDEETQEVQDKTTLWLPFSAEGCIERHYRDELNALQATGDYPYLSVALYYENMARPWLHELSRKAKINPMDHMVTEDGKSVPAPKKLTPQNVIEQKFQNKQGKFKIKILKKQTAEGENKPQEEKTIMEKLSESGVEKADLFPEGNEDADNESPGTRKTKKIK